MTKLFSDAMAGLRGFLRIPKGNRKYIVVKRSAALIMYSLSVRYCHVEDLWSKDVKPHLSQQLKSHQRGSKS